MHHRVYAPKAGSLKSRVRGLIGSHFLCSLGWRMGTYKGSKVERESESVKPSFYRYTNQWSLSVAKPTARDRPISQRQTRSEGARGKRCRKNITFILGSCQEEGPVPYSCSVGPQCNSVSDCLPWGSEAVGRREGRGEAGGGRVQGDIRFRASPRKGRGV